MRLPDRSRSYAVLIGTGTYQSDHLPNIAGVAGDLNDLAAALTHPQFGWFPPHHCRVVNDPIDGLHVVRTLKRISAAATDMFLIYYAGHGVTSQRHDLHLALPATDMSAIETSAVPFAAIQQVLAQCPADHRVLILDCCYPGGTAAESPHQALNASLAQIDIHGMYALATSPSTTPDLAGWMRNEAFTDILAQLLTVGDPHGGEVLTLADAYRRLCHAARLRGLPMPQLRGAAAAEMVALAGNPAYPRGAPGVGFSDRRSEALPASLAEQAAVTDSMAQAMAIEQAAQMLDSNTPLDAVVEFAQRITRRSPRDTVLRMIVMRMGLQDGAGAISIANQIDDPQRRLTTLRDLASVLGARDSGLARQAWSEIERLRSRMDY